MVWAGIPPQRTKVLGLGWVSKSLPKSSLLGLNHRGVTDRQIESCDWESSSQSSKLLSKKWGANILMVFPNFPLLCSPHCTLGSHWALSTPEAGSLLPTGRNQTLYGLGAHLVALASATATEAVCHFSHRLGALTHPVLPSGILLVSSWASDFSCLIYKVGTLCNSGSESAL